MSFFDAADAPRRAPQRRPAGPRRPRRPASRPSSGPPRDRSSLLRRRLIAFAIVVVVIVLIAIAINALRTSAHRSSLRSYKDNAIELVRESDHQVSGPFFALLGRTGGQPQADVTNLQQRLNELHALAAQQVTRAAALSTPGEMRQAEQDLVLALTLRRDSLGVVAQLLPRVVSGARGAAPTRAIAGRMRPLLASDVVLAEQFVPQVRRALADGGVTDETVPTPPGFLPTIQWLAPGFVAARLGGGATSRTPGAKVAPGSHGHGITSVSAGGVALQSQAANRLVASPTLSFTVNLQNQGSNDEHNVVVKLVIAGAGRTIEKDKTVATTTGGQSASVTIPIAQTPPIGTPVTITATVVPVPGEQVKTNNSQSFQAIFSRS